MYSRASMSRYWKGTRFLMPTQHPFQDLILVLMSIDHAYISKT